MKNLLKNQGGFTLVEVLIVIFILGIMASLAIGGYSSYRRSALLDLGVDSFVSQIAELRSQIVFGESDSDRSEQIRQELSGEEVEAFAPEEDRYCYGVYLKSEGEGYFAAAYREKFVGKKIWLGNNWSYQGCSKDFNDFDPELLPLDVDELWRMENVSFDGLNANQIAFRFVPPDAQLEISVNGSSFKRDIDPGQLLKFQAFYGLSERSRTVLLDLASVTYEIIN